MKIGVDASPLRDQMTGVGNYLFYLLQELVQQRVQDMFYLYAIRDSRPLQFFRYFPNVEIRIHPLFGFSEALWSQTTLSFSAFRDNLDAFWGAAQAIPLLTRKKQRHVITIHDFTYLLYPKTTTRVRGSFLRWFGNAFYQKADLRITISQGTATRLETLYGLHAHLVLPPPLKNLKKEENGEILKRYDLTSRDYFLMIGTREPRKNIVAALMTYQSLLHSHPLPPLVLVGKKGWRNQQMEKELCQLAQSSPSQIKMIDYLSDEELNQLVAHAKAYIMPSLYEGYGMPIAEARSLGTPVICSANAEMMEAAEGDALFISLDNFQEELAKAFLSPPTRLKKPCTYPSRKMLGATLSQTISAILPHSYSSYH